MFSDTALFWEKIVSIITVKCSPWQESPASGFPVPGYLLGGLDGSRGIGMGRATHRHGDGNVRHAGVEGPVWPADGGPGGDADDPWGGAGLLLRDAPCPGWDLTRDGTADHGALVWFCVAAT